MVKKQKVDDNQSLDLAIFGDLRFPKSFPGADYDTIYRPTLTNRDIYKITACYESSVLFGARQG